MRSRDILETLIREDRWDELSSLVAEQPRVIRGLLSLTYEDDSVLRSGACRGLAIAARYHSKLVSDIVRRLVWAMNDESGTHAVNAPEVILTLSREAPEILLPMSPDLVRLSGDEGLRDKLLEALRNLSSRHPGEVGRRLGKSLTETWTYGADRER